MFHGALCTKIAVKAINSFHKKDFEMFKWVLNTPPAIPMKI